MLSSSLTEDLLFLLGSKDFLFQVRKLASVCGKIFSALGNCIGNITRLMTRDTFAVVNSVTNWNSLVSPAPDCINELNYWKDNLATGVQRCAFVAREAQTNENCILRCVQFNLRKLNSVRGNNPSPELVRFRELSELRISWVPCRFTVFSIVYRLPRGTNCCRLQR